MYHPAKILFQGTVLYGPRQIFTLPKHQILGRAAAASLKRIYVSVYSERFKKIISIK